MWPDGSFTLPSIPTFSPVFSFLFLFQLKVKPERRHCQLLSLVYISRLIFFSYPTSSPNPACVLCHVIPSPPPFWAGFPAPCQACAGDSWTHQVSPRGRGSGKCCDNPWQRASGRAPSSSEQQNWARTAASRVSPSRKFPGATALQVWQKIPSLFIHLTQFPDGSNEKKNIFSYSKLIFHP